MPPKKPPTTSRHLKVLNRGGEHSSNAPRADKTNHLESSHGTKVEGIDGIKSILDDDDENRQPRAGASSSPTTSSSALSDTAALYNELDNFRQRWKRELETKKPEADTANKTIQSKQHSHLKSQIEDDPAKSSLSSNLHNIALKQSFSTTSADLSNNPKQVYALAKKLFLIGVDLEQDEMHHESIRYYKQAMHLCPDIEKQIFREQCEASAKASLKAVEESKKESNQQTILDRLGYDEDKVPILDRIRQIHSDELKEINEKYVYCKPASKLKAGVLHISMLPQELMLTIFRYVIGEELDLASLESLGMVCRGLFILSREQSLWRGICHSTWDDGLAAAPNESSQPPFDSDSIDWRQTYLTRPRLNFDGVYISRTRYIRQGDVGFQDITYRPFHVIRYYRYLRFFPNKRVLILTTNEEPERIVPIFRHALHAKQFSPELSILEGTYELCDPNQIHIIADKDCRAIMKHSLNQKRQGHLHWSRQTPLAQRFSYKFELKTIESKPYRNNVLKWLDYTISTRLETGQEITTFDLGLDTFPSLMFNRVRRFNLKSSRALISV